MCDTLGTGCIYVVSAYVCVCAFLYVIWVCSTCAHACTQVWRAKCVLFDETVAIKVINLDKEDIDVVRVCLLVEYVTWVFESLCLYAHSSLSCVPLFHAPVSHTHLSHTHSPISHTLTYLTHIYIAHLYTTTLTYVHPTDMFCITHTHLYTTTLNGIPPHRHVLFMRQGQWLPCTTPTSSPYMHHSLNTTSCGWCNPLWMGGICMKSCKRHTPRCVGGCLYMCVCVCVCVYLHVCICVQVCMCNFIHVEPAHLLSLILTLFPMYVCIYNPHHRPCSPSMYVHPTLTQGLPDTWIAIIMRHCLEALAYIHAQGYVHRDIKVWY